MTTATNKTSKKWTWLLTIVVISLAAFAYFYMEPISNLSVSFRPIYDKNDNRIREKLEREIDVILKQTDSRDRDAYETAMNELSTINRPFDLAERGIEPAVEELTSLKGCALLCYYMAKDKFTGNYETETRIKTVIDAHIGQNVLYASQEMENVLSRLNDKLARNTTDMKVRLASFGETVNNSQDQALQKAFKEYVSHMGAVSEKCNEIALGTVTSVLGLTISAVLVKNTLRQATNVLGHIAQRLEITTTSAIISSAADGPVPIGDAIGLIMEAGGTAWCTYDLYKAQILLKKQVKIKLTNALAQYRRQVLAMGKENSNELLKTYHNNNLKIANDLINHI